MATKPIAMSTLKQIIRLKEQDKGIRQIVRICNTSRNTVRKYLALIGQTSYSISELHVPLLSIFNLWQGTRLIAKRWR